jgi:hypothetical protein
MAPQASTPELRRFLAITFWVGSRANGYLVGPVLVSTCDYKRFHFYDEPSAAVLAEDEYEIVKVYRLGLTYAEVTLQFANDFGSTASGPYRSAGWIGADRTFYSAEGWADVGQHAILAA